jgi:hypothetical protein
MSRVREGPKAVWPPHQPPASADFIGDRAADRISHLKLMPFGNSSAEFPKGITLKVADLVEDIGLKPLKLAATRRTS